MLRIGLVGQSRFAALAFDALTALPGVTISAVCPTVAANQDSFGRKVADLPGVATCQAEHLRERDYARRFIAHSRTDLLVLANCPIIIPAAVLDAPLFRSLCFHPSLLPRHRGIDATTWTLVLGDRETGVTIFRPDSGIDSGPILVQRSCAVPPFATPSTLYHETLVPLGITALCEAVALVRDGRAVFTPQDESCATYEPPYTPLVFRELFPTYHDAGDRVEVSA